MKHILYLLLLATICMGIWLGVMQYEEKWGYWPHYEYLQLSFVFIPILFFAWVMWINGKEKFWKRLIAYFSISFLFIGIFLTAIILTSFVLSMIPHYSDSFDPDSFDGKIMFSSFFLAFAVATLAINLVLAIYEKRMLSKMNLWVVFLSSLAIPLICKLWYLVLPTPFNGEGHLMEASHNGSFIFAFIIYEGTYFLWLKEKIWMPISLRERVS